MRPITEAIIRSDDVRLDIQKACLRKHRASTHSSGQAIGQAYRPSLHGIPGLKGTRCFLDPSGRGHSVAHRYHLRIHLRKRPLLRPTRTTDKTTKTEPVRRLIRKGSARASEELGETVASLFAFGLFDCLHSRSGTRGAEAPSLRAGGLR